jgi:hypothetical protein
MKRIIILVFLQIIFCSSIIAQTVTFTFDELKGKSYIYWQSKIIKIEEGKIISIFNYDSNKIIYRLYKFKFINSPNDFDGVDIIKAISLEGKTIYSINASLLFKETENLNIVNKNYIVVSSSYKFNIYSTLNGTKKKTKSLPKLDKCNLEDVLIFGDNIFFLYYPINKNNNYQLIGSAMY